MVAVEAVEVVRVVLPTDAVLRVPAERVVVAVVGAVVRVPVERVAVAVEAVERVAVAAVAVERVPAERVVVAVAVLRPDDAAVRVAALRVLAVLALPKVRLLLLTAPRVAPA